MGTKARVFWGSVLTAALPAAALFLVSYAALRLVQGELLAQRKAFDEAQKRLSVLEAKNQEQALQNEIQQTAADLITKLDNYVSGETDVVSTIAKLPPVVSMDSSTVTGALDQQLESRAEMEALFAMDVRQRGVAHSPPHPGFVGSDQTNNQDANQARTGFRPVVSEITGAKVHLYAPIVSIEGKPRGALGARLRFSALASQTNELVKRGFTVFLTSRKTGRVTATFPESAHADESLDPVLKRIAAGEAGGTRTKGAGNPYVGYGHLSEADWGACVQMSEQLMVQLHKKAAEAGAAAGAGGSSALARAWLDGPYAPLRNPWALAAMIALLTLLAALVWMFVFGGDPDDGRAPSRPATAPSGDRDGPGGSTRKSTTRTITQQRREEIIKGDGPRITRGSPPPLPRSLSSVEVEEPPKKAFEPPPPARPAIPPAPAGPSETEKRLHEELARTKAEMERMAQSVEKTEREKTKLLEEVTHLDVELKTAKSPEAVRQQEEMKEFVELQGREAIAPTDPVALGEMLKQTILHEQRAAEEKRLSWDVSLDAKVPALGSNRERLAEVLQFVVSRLVAGSPSFSKLSVQLGPKDGVAEITLQSSGIQVSAADASGLFTRFHGESTALGPFAKGTGLQFGIKRRLFELLGGKLELVPDPVKGTRFTLRLPLPAGAAPSTPPPSASASNASSTAGPATATQVVVNVTQPAGSARPMAPAPPPPQVPKLPGLRGNSPPIVPVIPAAPILTVVPEPDEKIVFSELASEKPKDDELDLIKPASEDELKGT